MPTFQTETQPKLINQIAIYLIGVYRYEGNKNISWKHSNKNRNLTTDVYDLHEIDDEIKFISI